MTATADDTEDATGLFKTDLSRPMLTLLTSENPPFTIKAPESGVATGAAVDLLKTMMDRAGFNYSLALLPWNRAYQRARTEADTCVFVTNRLKERENLFTWIGPLFEGGWALYRRPDSTLVVRSIADLKGLAISGTFTPEQTAFVKNVYHAVPLQVEDDEAAARLLYKGRADLWLSGLLRHRAIVRRIGAPSAEHVFTLARADLYMACNPEMDAEVIAQLNDLNEKLAPERNAILAKYGLGPVLPSKNKSDN